LSDVQRNYVKQIVRATAGNWNVIYEIMNEPGFGGASADQAHQWHQQIAAWIREEIADMQGEDSSIPDHLIAVCDGEDALDTKLNADPCFDIFSWHGSAGGWNSDQAPASNDPCYAPTPFDAGSRLRTERTNIRNFKSSCSKHLIVDTDGVLSGHVNPYAYSRDYDENCLNWMTVALLEGQSFDSKEVVDNDVNPGERDCSKNDDSPEFTETPVPDPPTEPPTPLPGSPTLLPTNTPAPTNTPPPGYFDEPYFEGMRKQLASVFNRPQIHLAGFGRSDLSQDYQQFEAWVVQVEPYNSYGNGRVSSAELFYDDDPGLRPWIAVGNAQNVTVPWLPKDASWSGLDLYHLPLVVYPTPTPLMEGFYMTRMQFNLDTPTPTPAGMGLPTNVPTPDDRWPGYTIYKSHATDKLPPSEFPPTPTPVQNPVLSGVQQFFQASENAVPNCLEQYQPLIENLAGVRETILSTDDEATFAPKPYILWKRCQSSQHQRWRRGGVAQAGDGTAGDRGAEHCQRNGNADWQAPVVGSVGENTCPSRV